MKDKTELLALIRSTSSFLLTAHIFPDGDNIGSLVALRAGLLKLGKKVQIAIDDTVPSTYMFLEGSRYIMKPKDIEAGYEVIIVLDSSSIDRIGAVQGLVGPDMPMLNIDHHISNTGFGTIQHVDSQAAATAEIIYQLLLDLGVEFDREIATALYAGIATDCGFFKYANTSPRTMHIAADMIAFGALPNEISDAVETRSLTGLKLLARVLDRVEISDDSKIAWLYIDQELLGSVSAEQEDTEGFINYIRYIDGVEVAVLFREVPARGIKVSMRSRRNVDVSAIALRFGGGGHIRAAGCSFAGTLEEAKDKVLAAIHGALG
jgi:bifunctional oligoribonuclease and PAP phosphatase NrnA